MSRTGGGRTAGSERGRICNALGACYLAAAGDGRAPGATNLAAQALPTVVACTSVGDSLSRGEDHGEAT